MRIDRSYISNQNTYAENDPRCIVVHNTDNFAAGANALAHARAQYNGNFANMSAHYYVDDGDTAYQAAPHSRGCWHVGVNYGGNNLFGRYGNRSSIGVEMCVQAGYNYEKAFRNTVAVVEEIMRETGIPASRVYRHYDICSKHCPSQIIERGDWERFKSLISGAAKEFTSKAIAVDGVWGHELTKRLQEIFKTGVDGVISNQPTSNKKYCAGIAAAEWSGKLSGGSDLIKAMQKWAGVTADGYIGPQTIRALQKKLGTPVDGVISYPSAMVTALQKWCNRQ